MNVHYKWISQQHEYYVQAVMGGAKRRPAWFMIGWAPPSGASFDGCVRVARLARHAHAVLSGHVHGASSGASFDGCLRVARLARHAVLSGHVHGAPSAPCNSCALGDRGLLSEAVRQSRASNPCALF